MYGSLFFSQLEAVTPMAGQLKSYDHAEHFNFMKNARTSASFDVKFWN
jgi:hypothetical protein